MNANPDTVTSRVDAAMAPSGVRSALYALLREAFGYPRGELLDAIRDGVVAQSLRLRTEALDPPLGEPVDWQALQDAGEAPDTLAVEYTRLFDPGTSAPPCPLFGGLHVAPQMTTMEEVLRFYQHFGLAPANTGGETPDHLTAELEFLHVLAWGETDLQSRGEDASAWQRGRRDFIARHPGRWVPMLREKLERQAPPRYYRALVRLLEQCLDADLGQLEALHGPASREPHRSMPS